MRPALPRTFYLLPLVLYLLTLTLSSCKKDKPAPDLGYGYIPANVGHWVIYQVDSTAQDDPIGLDTTYHFQVKEVIQSVYTDNSGRPTLRIERYRKNYNPLVPYSQQQWSGPHVYSANLTSTTYERVEENFRYTRFVFPARISQKWNANANNVLEAWSSKFSSLDQPGNVNSLSFDSVATVQEEIDTNLVDYKYAVARYAKHVGLVYRRLVLMSRQPENMNDTAPFNDTVALSNPASYQLLSQNAIIYEQKIISWGN